MWKISFHAVDFPLPSYSPFISISRSREVTSNGVQPWSLKSAHQTPRTFFPDFFNTIPLRVCSFWALHATRTAVRSFRRLPDHALLAERSFHLESPLLVAETP